MPFTALQHCENVLALYLLPIFNASLRLGYMPKDWKIAVVVPVPKPKGDPSNVKGYRPISLLPCLAKTLESILIMCLSFALESTGLLSPKQFGFRRTRSTEDALWAFATAATSALQSRQRLIALSLDFKGAYDHVWHPGFLSKLMQLHAPHYMI